jgi:RNA polymerase sigma-70 factor (ECF subfamily)
MIGRDDDQSLVRACRAGDRDAFGVLVRRYQDRLFSTALRLTGRAEDAHDLLQDAFFRAYQKLGHFHGDSSFYTWVYRITVNLALSGRRKRRPVAEATSRAMDVADESGLTDPALPLERAERDHRIQAALDDLGDDHRAVVVMKDLDGLRYEEIAAILGVPVGTVRSRLHRARCELRERLRGLVEESPVLGG